MTTPEDSTQVRWLVKLLDRPQSEVVQLLADAGIPSWTYRDGKTYTSRSAVVGALLGKDLQCQHGQIQRTG